MNLKYYQDYPGTIPYGNHVCGKEPEHICNIEKHGSCRCEDICTAVAEKENNPHGICVLSEFKEETIELMQYCLDNGHPIVYEPQELIDELFENYCYHKYL